MKDKFRMEAEEEKYQEFRESVAEMKNERRMDTEEERFQKVRDSIAAKMNRMAEEQLRRFKNLVKYLVIKVFVLLFYVSSH